MISRRRGKPGRRGFHSGTRPAGAARMTAAQQPEQKGIQKGLEQEIQSGRDGGIREVARTLLQNGLCLYTIMKMTGLSEEERVQFPH